MPHIKDARRSPYSLVQPNYAQESQNPGDEYRIRVNRESLPDIATLHQAFGEDRVHSYFDGTHEWVRHSSRTGENDVWDEYVDVLVKWFTGEEADAIGGLSDENIIAWGLKCGLLPADEKEMCAFGMDPVTADLSRQLDFMLIGLGACVMIHPGLCVVATLDYNNSSRQRCIDAALTRGSTFRSGPRRRFLFVRVPPARSAV